jgi:hypothetical protein
LLHVAVANFILNVRKTRRNSSQPVIDYDLILVMQPNLLRTPYTAEYHPHPGTDRTTFAVLVLVGATVGTFANRIAPSWLLCVLLVALLVVTSYRTLQKGVRMRKKETWNFFSQQSEASSLVSKPQAAAAPSVEIP